MRFGFFTAAIGTLAVIGGLLLLLRGPQAGDESESIYVYYAAGLRLPIEETIEAYRKEFDVEIQTSAQGSGELQGNIVASEQGDLFIAADISYLQQLNAIEKAGSERDFIDEILPFATQRPVIAVPVGNPLKIRSLQDLLRDDVRVSLADPGIAAIGRAARDCMPRELWDKIWDRKQVGRPKVPLVAGDVAMGAADAGIVWDATASQFDKLEIVSVPEFDAHPSQIAIGVLKSTKNAARARHFARYLIARDRGLKYFRQHGYRVIEGDAWTEEE